jgi:putative peptide maturation system protein
VSNDVSKGAREALLAVWGGLVELARDGVGPAEAEARMRRLARRLPKFPLELVWERQALGGPVHYDALLRLPGGTASLSVAPADAVPWPLRGAHHPREYELVSVNGRVLTIEEAIACCDGLWDEARITARLVDMCLMDEALRALRLRVREADLQEAMDAFRAARGLRTAASTEAWLHAHGLTEEELASQLRGELARGQLRAHVTKGQVAAHFAAHARTYDRANLARFAVPERAVAERLCAAIAAGTEDFFAVAERLFVAGEGDGKLFTTVRRGALGPAPATLIFGAPTGPIVVPSGGRFEVVRVLGIVTAVLDSATREEVAADLFEAWLCERRAAAQIEWFWGQAPAADD